LEELWRESHAERTFKLPDAAATLVAIAEDLEFTSDQQWKSLGKNFSNGRLQQLE